jgi:diaminopimelate epimerase
MLDFIKAHAYGNDFLFTLEDQVQGRDWAALARAACERHRGIGADGLIFYRLTPRGAAMHLLNADGSPSEVSGNGVRCLATIVAAGRGLEPASDPAANAGDLADAADGRVVIETDAGDKLLTLLKRDGDRYTFCAEMGRPADLRQMDLTVDGEPLQVVALRVGNPQCIVLEPHLDERRYRRFGQALEHHPAFPQGTNVEFVEVMSPQRIRILIWERGVGPTEASGTGACGSAVAAAAFGGAGRDLEVISVGGSQRVEWRDEGLRLTGWAEVVCRGCWSDTIVTGR